MSKRDERLEHLINRKLDQALTAEESYELDKRLIRDPQVRRQLEEMQQVDLWSAELLNAVCHSGPPAAVARISARPQGRRWWRLLAPAAAAVAACLILGIAWLGSGRGLDGRAGITPPVMESPPTDWMRLVDTGSPVRERGTVLDYYGVLDDKEDALYLLEVKHTTEHHRQPAGMQPAGTVLLASGEM